MHARYYRMRNKRGVAVTPPRTMASPAETRDSKSTRKDSAPRLSWRQEWRRRLAHSLRRRRSQETRSDFVDEASFDYTPAPSALSSHKKQSRRGSPLNHVRIGKGSRNYSCPDICVSQGSSSSSLSAAFCVSVL